MTATIPQPRTTPLLGNLPDLDRGGGVLRLVDLAKEYGPIYRLELPGANLIVVGSHALVDELCDESRFTKMLHRPLREVRDFAADGLFTAETDEPNWGVAHRILMPTLGPAALPPMFEGMVDIADQLLLKWERQGPDHRIDVVDDTTRLTLDTIALCAFGYRLNSFYTERMHPFVGAMVRALVEAGARTQRLPLQNRVRLRSRLQYEEDKRLMYQVADQLITDRRRRGPDPERRDLLDVMLTGTDPRTGQGLSDENIRFQVVTFLIAGHETTSGLLSFALYELLRHPEVHERARALVDDVLGGGPPRFESLPRLGYLDQVLKETLRLWPTAPAFALRSLQPEDSLGGRYPVSEDDILLVLTPALHRDPAVWGPDPDSFDPDRFAPQVARERPGNAWKPFGNGMRSCIGRGFALQEATLFLAMMLQRFDITSADPDYRLQIAQTLTIKPDGLFVHARRRDGLPPTAPEPGGHATSTAPTEAPAPVPASDAERGPVRILFGSNSGTCQSFAQRVANDSQQRGYTPSLDTLDSAVENLTADAPIIILTSSYEGQPPDNAKEFVRWIEQLPDNTLDGIRYAILGCGNSDWTRTYQAVPKTIDHHLTRAGARRLHTRGEADAAADLFGDFEDWYTGLWDTLAGELGHHTREPVPAPLLELEFTTHSRQNLLRHNQLQLGTVVANRDLVDPTAPGARPKLHVEIALPEGSTYQTGDYLAVLPMNPPGIVDRALARFELAYDSQVTIRGTAQTHTLLPTDIPVTVGELLASYVELSQPASRTQIEQLAAATTRQDEKNALQRLVHDRAAYKTDVLEPRLTLLDLLERHPDSDIAFVNFLQALPPLTPRRYSISSSPLWNPGHATLTVAVVRAPARSGNGTYEGVASTFLARARPGSQIPVTVQASNTSFCPPDTLDTPIVMVCAGTGIAPFRGFLQHRALQAEAQQTRPAPALLFFGCDHPDLDYLYNDELRQWTDNGIVDVRPAFSGTAQDQSQYVQDRLWNDRADVIELVRHNANFYLCGDGRRMAPAVHDTCVRIHQDATGSDQEQAETWITEMEREHGRYVADVFA